MNDDRCADRVLLQPVFVDGRYKPFGAFTAAEVQARADELRAAVGWGPTAKVAAAARGWSELARDMSRADAATVAELGSEAAAPYGERL